MWRSFAFSLAVLALLPVAALAQSKFEISPFAGVRSAGSFRPPPDAHMPALQAVTFDVSSAPTFGTFFNYDLVGNLELEVLWGHQSSNVVEKRANVQDPQNPTETELFDISINYFQGGLLYSGGNETFDPYIAVGFGSARLSADGAEASSVSKFSFSIGGGLKGYLSDRVGFRFDARAFGTRAGDRREDVACGVFGCASFTVASTFWQSHFVGAVMIRF